MTRFAEAKSSSKSALRDTNSEFTHGQKPAHANHETIDQRMLNRSRLTKPDVTCGNSCQSPHVNKLSCSGAKSINTGARGVDERLSPLPVTPDSTVGEAGIAGSQQLIDLHQPIHRRLVWNNQDQCATLLPHSGKADGTLHDFLSLSRRDSPAPKSG